MEKGFIINGVNYIETEKGYFYKVEDGKKSRIKKAEYEQAFDQYCEISDDVIDEQVDEWMAEINEAKEAHAEAQAESDKQAEDAVNGKKSRKPRKSKDIALEGVFAIGEDISVEITLTAKQVDFIKHVPDTCFYEHGLESTMWCDVLADEIGGQFAGKPMTVGAMISTLREKNVIYVNEDRINGKKCKFFGFTSLGKQIAKELGLN